MNKLFPIFIIAVLLLSLGSVSWGQDQPKVLKIGIATALTGPGAGWGIPFRDATILLDGKIIVIGGEKYEVKLVYEDNKYTAKDGVTAMEKLVFDHKVKFVACMGTPPTMATIPIAEENKVILTGVTTVAQAAKPGIKYFFRLILTSKDMYPTTYRWLSKNRPNLKRIAQLAPQVEQGEASIKAGTALAAKYGLEMVYQEFYKPGTQDFYPHLTKMIRAKPDILDVCISFPAVTALIIKQARELGWKGVVFNVAGADPEDIIKVAGVEAAEGYMTFVGSTEYDMSSPVCTKTEQEFYKKYFNKYGYFRLGAGMWYDNASIIVNAIQKAQSFDVEKVRKIMETEVLESVAGPSKFGIQEYGGHQLLVPMYISKITKGKAETFARIEWKDWAREAGYTMP